MRRLIAALMIALSASACDPPDLDNGVANRVQPTPGPNVAQRVATLVLTPAEFRTGQSIAAHASFPQPLLLSPGLGCPDPENQGRTVSSDRSYHVAFVPLDEAGQPIPDKVLAQTDLPYENANQDAWQEKDFPAVVAPGAPASGRLTVNLIFSQNSCEYQNSVGIPRTNRQVIVSLPYRYTCPGQGTTRGEGVCRYVRDDGQG